MPKLGVMSSRPAFEEKTGKERLRRQKKEKFSPRGVTPLLEVFYVLGKPSVLGGQVQNDAEFMDELEDIIWSPPPGASKYL